MRTKTAKYIASLMLVGLIFGPLGVCFNVAANNNGLFAQNENISIKVTGDQNVPQYTFWRPNQNETDYQVKFTRLFEALDEDENGQYDKGADSIIPSTNEALSSMRWNFSAVENIEGSLSFNITSYNQSFTVQFRNYLNPTAAELKFDVVIENYSFSSEDDKAILVLGFQLLGNRNRISQEGNEVTFGDNGYFGAENNATAGNQTIGAMMTEAEEAGTPMAFIAFERFEGKLVYDPTIGLTSTLAIPGSRLAIFLPAFALGIIFIALRQRKRQTI